MGTGSITFSPDGKLLAMGYTHFCEEVAELGGILHFWDLEAGQMRFRLENAKDAHKGLAFSPDGTRLACGSTSGGLQIVDTQTGAVLAALAV